MNAVVLLGDPGSPGVSLPHHNFSVALVLNHSWWFVSRTLSAALKQKMKNRQSGVGQGPLCEGTRVTRDFIILYLSL